MRDREYYVEQLEEVNKLIQDFLWTAAYENCTDRDVVLFSKAVEQLEHRRKQLIDLLEED